MVASFVSSRVDPAFLTGPRAAGTLGPEVAQVSDLAGFPPDEEQRLILDGIFGYDERGRSAAFECCVVCARQNLKTGVFKQAALGWLHITDQRLVVWSAHEFRTAQEAFRDMDELHAAHPSLARRVKKVYRGNGDEAIELVTGQRLIFKARTKAGGRGLSGDKVVLDEAFALHAEHMGALLPTLSVRPDPQVVYGSSAGLATSDVLRGVRDRGRVGSSPRLFYCEWCAPKDGQCERDNCSHDLGTPGCALDDVELWRLANPLLGKTRANGTGLTVDYLASERQALPPGEFARERMGWWDEPDSPDAIFGPGKWDACAESGRVPDDLPVASLAVAVSFDLTAGAIGGAYVDADERIYVRPAASGPGTGWLVDECDALTRKHGVELVIDGKGPAAMLLPALDDRGVPMKVIGTGEVLDACAGFFDAVMAKRLAHDQYPELNDALGVAVKRDVGDRWAWGRRKSEADISVLEAVTFAAWQASLGEGVNLW